MEIIVFPWVVWHGSVSCWSAALDNCWYLGYSLVDGSIFAPTTERTSQQEGVGPHQENLLTGVLALFLKAAPWEFFDQLRQRLGKRRSGGVFSMPVVVWLMLFQRLHGKGTLWVAVQEAVRGLPADLVPQPCQRLRHRTVSNHTGGYNQARQKLPPEVVESVADRIFQQLTAAEEEALPGLGRRVFLLDGSTLLTPHTPELTAAYPPQRNQHGRSHWPVLRIVVAHDVVSGVAMRPQWGAMSGPQAVSEQSLLAAAMERLPPGSVVLGDQNFGVFSVAYGAAQQGHPVLLRLTRVRAEKLWGSVVVRQGTDRRLEWKPTRWDRQAHPELPPEAAVAGRLIACKVYPSDGSSPIQLHFFTALDIPMKQIVELYGWRWNIETDLRSLKRTVGLHMLRSLTPAMLAKELILGVTAYNLVRALMNTAARQANLDPRRLSFSRAQDVVHAWLPTLAAATSEKQFQAELQRVMGCLARCKLYPRKKRRSYPRQVWGRPRVYPTRKSERNDRAQ